MEHSGVTRIRIVFVPRAMHARIAMHSFATATSAVVAARMGTLGNSWLTGIAWYFGSFVGIHVVFASFLAAWFVACDRADRWVRGIIEEELIRFDLRTYERQMHRVFPALSKAPDERVEP